MLIVCPSCATSYDVETASLLPDGRQVRCARCRTIWHAEAPTKASLLVAAADALGPELPPAHPILATAKVPPPPLPTAARTAPLSRADEPGADDELPGLLGGGSEGWSSDPAFFGSPDDIDVEAPPIAPTDLDAGLPPIDIESDQPVEQTAPPSEDVETVAARRFPRPAKRPRRRWPMSLLPTAILAFIILDSIVVGWRKDIVRLLPQTASFYAAVGLAVNLRGISFDKITTTVEEHEGVPILVVQGDIVNPTGAMADVPRLKLAVRNAAKQEVYSWTAAPPRATLSPGQAVEFRTRLASPPPDSHDIVVRFVNRRDIVAETH